jgi:hypothetical protein
MATTAVCARCRRSSDREPVALLWTGRPDGGTARNHGLERVAIQVAPPRGDDISVGPTAVIRRAPPPPPLGDAMASISGPRRALSLRTASGAGLPHRQGAVAAPFERSPSD